MARLLRLLPDPASPHKPRSVDPSKIACVSLAAMANQAKPLRGVTPSRRSKVPSGGRGWFTNRVMAHVRTPGGPTSPTQRLFRDARSSPNLCARPSLTRSNRRGTGPVCPVVWEGWRREASPYPDPGRSFAVPGRFLKAAILPNPAFDADSQIRLDHAGSSDSAFVVVCTICASRTHIPAIATRLCVGTSGNRRAHVSRISAARLSSR